MAPLRGDARLQDRGHQQRLGGGHGGSITAALFLRRFVEAAKAWVHLDVFAWTPSAKPGRPEGGECQAARALYGLLRRRNASGAAAMTALFRLPLPACRGDLPRKIIRVRNDVREWAAWRSSCARRRRCGSFTTSTWRLSPTASPDLSARQLAVLLTIYLEAPPHTVRGLAAKLRVTKPVITRALDTMGKLDLVSRRRDAADRRNVVIQRTVKGALYVEKLGDLLIAKAQGLPR